MSWHPGAFAPRLHGGELPGGFPTLKEMIAHDVGSGRDFFSLEGFAVVRDIKVGDTHKQIPCVLTKRSVQEFQRSVSGRTLGRSALDVERSQSKVYTDHWELLVRVADFGPRPAHKAKILIDRTRKMEVQSCQEDYGVYYMVLEETKV